MKHPPKPFAIEIKRSRRGSTPGAPDLLKDSTTTAAAARAGTARRTGGLKAAPELDFAVPAFLQTEKTASPAVQSANEEAARVFRTGPAPVEAPPLTQPRILPSLVPPKEFGFEPPAAEPKPRGRPRRAAAERTPQPKAKPAAEDATPRVKPPAAVAAAGTRRAEKGPANGEVKGAVKPAGRSAAALRPAETAPAAVSPLIERTLVRRAMAWRAQNIPSVVRRTRKDAASLPPGQQWKRRLNPRAW